MHAPVVGWRTCTYVLAVLAEGLKAKTPCSSRPSNLEALESDAILYKGTGAPWRMG